MRTLISVWDVSLSAVVADDDDDDRSGPLLWVDGTALIVRSSAGGLIERRIKIDIDSLAIRIAAANIVGVPVVVYGLLSVHSAHSLQCVSLRAPWVQIGRHIQLNMSPVTEGGFDTMGLPLNGTSSIYDNDNPSDDHGLPEHMQFTASNVIAVVGYRSVNYCWANKYWWWYINNSGRPTI